MAASPGLNKGRGENLSGDTLPAAELFFHLSL
jgi:hypothetical protein